MPRSTAKSKAKNGNVNLKSCNVSKKSTTTKTPKNDIRKTKCIKKELLADTAKETVTEEVFHRKSERRRVARDIFLVFEEESNSRRKTRGANKKQAKPKFGHLKVEDPTKTKGLLRDIKNEPRCYLNGNLSVNATVPPVVPVLKRNTNILKVSNREKKLKPEKIKAAVCQTVNSAYSNKSNNIKSIKISAVESQSCSLDNETRIVARVNPIFLWVKQDDTRIVEVRCEDYDKRNRIRITKTSNGWRAIPRSDPTSSKVLKFYPTPLMKVKRENHNHETNNNSINSHCKNKEATVVCQDYVAQKILPEITDNGIDAKLSGIDTVCNPLATKNVKSKTKHKKSKKLRKKSQSEKISKKSKTNITAIENLIVNSESLVTQPLNPLFTTNSSDESADLAYSNTNSIRSECKINNEQKSEESLTTVELVENINDQTFDENVETLENKPTSINFSLTIDVTSEAKSTYQKESEEEYTFHLCPRTGLFLTNKQVTISEYPVESFENENIQNHSKIAKNSFLNPSKEEVAIDMEKLNADSKIQLTEEMPESLEAKTKNLKDLLDDADLLQHCDDNANSDAELIDTLVKTSCENNLIQANEIITKATMDQLHQKTLQGPNEMVVQLIADVSDPPKCLSFNEAGEIEGLNGELFQSNTYMETFDKQSASILTEQQITLHSTTTLVPTSASASPQRSSTCENIEPILGIMDINNSSKVRSVSVLEDSPKDLSYKKREEVCPPSESRSQCAVTSSSDVVKSPQREDTSSLASSSETLKNLILEQFMKLNAMSTQHQRDPVDLGKQRHQEISNMKSLYTSNSGQSSDFIETVVIEDDDDNGGDSEHEQEPLKKRLRLNKHKVVTTQNVGKIAMIDKDPDPLTQLRLLIRNTQWKVPDPILVPKDRLSAVLASPAREIPLLITTRPELRLPEAFAYPEIIQNPNILVISMAQLEAILKNELEAEKTASSKVIEPDINQQSEEDIAVPLTNVKELQSQSSSQHLQNPLKQSTNNVNTDTTGLSTDALSEIRKENVKCSQTSSSLSSDLNSATMAVLNQMFWLPYFGQISQDIVKSLKNPMVLQEKCANLIPFLNSHLNGLANIDDIYKNTTNSNINKMTAQSASNTKLQSFQEQMATNDELSIFQKIVQHQMQSVLQLNQLKADSSQLTAPVAAVSVNAVSSIDKTNSNNIDSLSNLIEQRKQKVLLPNSKQTNPSTMCKSLTNNCSINKAAVTEKSYNLRSSVAGRHSCESKQYSNSNHRQITDNKPRLTCKSLSNLLDPEHSMAPSSSSSNPYVQNLSSDFLKSVTEIKRNSTECKVNRNTESKGTALSDVTTVPPSARPCSITNVSIDLNSELSKQKAKTFVESITPENNNVNNDASGVTTDTNIPLWHPLFGSNTKTAYSSPWQWTTVTATGE